MRLIAQFGQIRTLALLGGYCTQCHMHSDAFQIDDALIQTLLLDQLPEWAGLDFSRFDSDGTDNVIYRLGADMCMRLPIVPAASASLRKELYCIPRLPHLPLQISRPLAAGKPNDSYRSEWAVYQWIEGEAVRRDGISDYCDAAEALADFVLALHCADASDAPPYGRHNNFRGCPLVERDELTRKAIVSLSDLYNAAALTQVWEASIAIPSWQNELVWIHGDIHSGNLLMRNGQIKAVIDFGLMAAGDPAVDLIVSWSLFAGEARRRFRDVLNVDEATWLRGRGWALTTALVALAYNRDTNRFLADMSKQVLSEVLADFGTPE